MHANVYSSFTLFGPPARPALSEPSLPESRGLTSQSSSCGAQYREAQDPAELGLPDDWLLGNEWMHALAAAEGDAQLPTMLRATALAPDVARLHERQLVLIRERDAAVTELRQAREARLHTQHPAQFATLLAHAFECQYAVIDGVAKLEAAVRRQSAGPAWCGIDAETARRYAKGIFAVAMALAVAGTAAYLAYGKHYAEAMPGVEAERARATEHYRWDAITYCEAHYDKWAERRTVVEKNGLLVIHQEDLDALTMDDCVGDRVADLRKAFVEPAHTNLVAQVHRQAAEAAWIAFRNVGIVELALYVALSLYFQ